MGEIKIEVTLSERLKQAKLLVPEILGVELCRDDYELIGNIEELEQDIEVALYALNVHGSRVEF